MPEKIERTLTGTEVWDAIVKDPAFTDEIPEGPIRDAIRPFFEKSPEVLADFLEKPVTLQTLTDTKLALSRYYIDNRFGEAIESAMNISDGRVTSALNRAAIILEIFAEHTVELLDSHNISEAEVMLSPEVGLNETNKAAYANGTLMIGEILRTQPAVIFQNDR